MSDKTPASADSYEQLWNEHTKVLADIRAQWFASGWAETPEARDRAMFHVMSIEHTGFNVFIAPRQHYPGAKSIVGDYDDTWEKALEFRRRPGMAERFVDARFLDFRADPIGTVRSIYDRLGLDFSDDRAAAMEAWLASDASERSGRTHHQYSLADIGMTEGDIDRLTGDYLSAFDVPLERQGTV